ncbi:MAG TPA: hypothetical protein PLX21_10025, partial [Rhodocyclaceae bacterium]|nr:hypothetical protein [Rhodocyclaceae bacterium]
GRAQSAADEAAGIGNNTAAGRRRWNIPARQPLHIHQCDIGSDRLDRAPTTFVTPKRKNQVNYICIDITLTGSAAVMETPVKAGRLQTSAAPGTG